VDVGTGIGVEDGIGEGVAVDGVAVDGIAADGEAADSVVADGVTVSAARDGGSAGTNRRHARPVSTNTIHRIRFIFPTPHPHCNRISE